jgi:hypothetical protein
MEAHLLTSEVEADEDGADSHEGLKSAVAGGGQDLAAEEVFVKSDASEEELRQLGEDHIL